MRIIHFTNTFLPYVGGVPYAIDILARTQHELGHDVTVVAPDYGHSPEFNYKVIRVPAINNVDVGISNAAVPLITGSIGTMALSVLWPAHVVHVHHPFGLGEVGRALAKRWRCPVVFTYHTQYGTYAANAVGQIGYVMDSVAAEFCRRVYTIAPSEDIAQQLRRRGIYGVRVIPSAIDTRRFATGDGEAFRRRYSLPDFVVGTVSRLAPEKRLDFLAAALHGLPWLVVGDGPLRQQLTAQGAMCVGSLVGQDLVDAYHAMTVFTFASTSETQGLVVGEALASSRPVVAIDAPGVRDVVAGLPANTSPADFRAAVLAAAGKPAQPLPSQFTPQVQAEHVLLTYRALRCLSA